MRKTKGQLLFVLLAIVVCLCTMLTACGEADSYPVQTDEVKMETFTEGGVEQSVFVAYATTDPNAKNYGFIVRKSSSEKWTIKSTNIDANGKFSARITGIPEGESLTVQAYTESKYVEYGKKLEFISLVTTVESVELNAISRQIALGGEYELTATVKPSNIANSKVTWSSSDESIATVIDGVVKAIARGEANIRATAYDGTTYAECKVTVYENVSVSLDKEQITLFKGEQMKLNSSVTPSTATSTAVTWETSNRKVVTVDENGYVTAVGEGTAFVRARSVANDMIYAACMVTVAGEYKVVLNKTSLIMEEGQQETLIATIVSDQTVDKEITWSSSNENVITVNKGVITAVGKGTSYITAEANGIVAVCEVTVKDDIEIKFMLNGSLYAIRYTGPSRNYMIDMPANPEDYAENGETPYFFRGWYKSQSFIESDKISESTTYSASITLYAKTESIFTYTLRGGKVTITGLMDGLDVLDLVIPSTIAGYPVDAIFYGAFENSAIETLHFESGVVTIYDDAFRGCKSLDTVTFGKNSKLEFIGDSVFRDCEALTSIELPFGLESVGELVFYGCKKIPAQYGQLYSFNVPEKQHYSPKYTYEFLGEDVMPIGGYIEPSVGYFRLGVDLEKVIREYVESGTNVMIGIAQARHGTTSTHYKQIYEYFDKYGGMFLRKGGIRSHSSYNDTADDALLDWIDDYSNKYASFAGLHIEDEPGVSSWVPGLGEYSKYTPDAGLIPSDMQYRHDVWGDYLTRKLYYVNLLPVNSPIKAFAWGAENYNYQPNTDILWGEYQQYANYDYYYKTYIQYVKPQVFSYDFYPLWANGTSHAYLSYPELNSRHFEQLYKTRYYTTTYSQEVNGNSIPFWNFVQIAKWGNTTSGSRAATYREVVWQINTAFAYGSKGYQYFVFNDYGDITGQGLTSDYAGTTPINIDGTINEPVYNNVVKANTQSQAMAKWLLNADVDHLYQHGANPNNEATYQEMFESRNPSYNWAFESSSGVNNLVSHMTYYANNNEYVEGVAGDTRELYFVCNRHSCSCRLQPKKKSPRKSWLRRPLPRVPPNWRRRLPNSMPALLPPPIKPNCWANVKISF